MGFGAKLSGEDCWYDKRRLIHGLFEVTSKDFLCDSNYSPPLRRTHLNRRQKYPAAFLPPFMRRKSPNLLNADMMSIYIDEERGVDGTETHGTEASSFQSLLQAYLKHGSDNEYLVIKKSDEDFKPAAKAALKKAVNYADAQRKKGEAAAKRADKEEQETTAVEEALAAAQNIHVAEDPALPEAILIDIGETGPKVIGRLRKSQDEPPHEEAVRRVRVQGRVYRVARQGGLMFVTLRRGLSMMQCLLSGQLTKTYDALTLARETSMGYRASCGRCRPDSTRRSAGNCTPTTSASLRGRRAGTSPSPTGCPRTVSPALSLTCGTWPCVMKRPQL